MRFKLIAPGIEFNNTNYSFPVLPDVINEQNCFRPFPAHDDHPIYVPLLIRHTKTWVPSLLDTGSFGNLINHSVVTDLQIKMYQTKQVIRGVNSTTTAIGEIHVDMWIGNAYFPKVTIYVMPNTSLPIPIIIGRSLFNKRCKSMKIKFHNSERIVVFQSNLHKVEVRYSTHPRNDPFLSLTAKPDTMADAAMMKAKYDVTVDGSNATPEEIAETIKIFVKHQDVMVSDDKPLGRFNGFKARLETKPGCNAFRAQYRIPEKYMDQVQLEIEKMKKSGVIVPCDQNKNWNTPLGVVPKPNGAIRVVMNFKITLNPILVDEDSFSIPNINEETILVGGGNKYFASLDVRSGYFQIDLDERDQVKTCFQFNNQNYKFTRWPFGLRPAGSVFCRAIAHALRNVKRRSNYRCYVDDILIFAKSYEVFAETLDEILAALKEHGIMISGQKAHILTEPIKWLGRIIDRNGISPDPDHVNGIVAMKAPNNFRSLQSLIGGINWLRSHASVKMNEPIGPNLFSNVIKPITAILRSPKFVWTKEADKAFILLKERLQQPSIIHFADFSKPFVLCTDASINGVGYILMQEQDNLKWGIVRVGSKTLNDTQSRWSTIERECFAIVYAINDCEFFLRARSFILKCDHKPLTFLDRKTFRNAKVERWASYLANFNFIIQYIEGHLNSMADMFSRQNREKIIHDESGKQEIAGEFKKYGVFKIYIPSWASLDGKLQIRDDGDDLLGDRITALALTKGNDNERSQYDEIQHAQILDSATRLIIDALNGQYPCKWDESDEEHRTLREYEKRCKISNGLLTVNDRIYIPRGLRPRIIVMYHNERNHNGAARMLNDMKHLFWPSMEPDVRNVTESCVCTHKKGPHGRPTKPNTGHVTKGSRPFDRVSIDFIELPVSPDGFRYCLTIQCTFTRFLIVCPLRRNRAVDAARGLQDCLFTTYTTPSTIESDRGCHFHNSLLAEFTAMYGVSQKIHVSWRPQSTGQLERAHRTLKAALFVVMHERRVQWPTIIRTVVQIMNAAPNAALKRSPFEAVFGFKPKLNDFDPPGPMYTNVDDYLKDNHETRKCIQKHMQLCQQIADEKLEEQINPKRQARELEVGDEILLYRPNSAKAKSTRMPWVGPYQIIATSPYVVKISDSDGKTDWVHRAHVCMRPQRKMELGVPPPFPMMAPPIRKFVPEKLPDAARLVPEPIEPMIDTLNETHETTFESCTDESEPETEPDQTQIEPRRSARLNPDPDVRYPIRNRNQTQPFQAQHKGQSHE